MREYVKFRTDSEYFYAILSITTFHNKFCTVTFLRALITSPTY